MNYDLEKRIFLLEKYIKFEKISTAQHAYRSKYKNEPVPDTVQLWASFLHTKQLDPSYQSLQ
jgi:hypothetical protein